MLYFLSFIGITKV